MDRGLGCVGFDEGDVEYEIVASCSKHHEEAFGRHVGKDTWVRLVRVEVGA
jgi:hypothetical protein